MAFPVAPPPEKMHPDVDLRPSCKTDMSAPEGAPGAHDVGSGAA